MQPRPEFQNTTHTRRHSAFLVIALALLPSITFGQGLSVSPERLEFDGPSGFATLELVNNGRDSVLYQVRLVNYRMSPGELQLITAPDSSEHFATSFLRFFPHQVRLAPGVSQTVTVQLQLPAELPQGEYRSHLLLQAAEARQKENASHQSDEMAERIHTRPEIAIPIIVRHGQLQASASMSHVKLETDGQPILSLQIDRSGEEAISGNIVVSRIGEHAVAHEIASFKGIAIYPPE